MGVPGSANPLLLVQQGSTQYTVSRSLRFNSSDSAFCSRTPGSAGNRRTFTWSGWVKRGTLTTGYQTIFGAGTGLTSWGGIRINNSPYHDKIQVFEYIGGWVYDLTTTAVFRDPSAWYHLIVAVDTTQATASNRVKIYINGAQITAFDVATYPAQNTDLFINSTNVHTLGTVPTPNQEYFSGYLAECYLIDGQQLTPSSFGETNTTTGQWVPKAYTGSYGTNGFKLTFSNNSNTTSATLGKDTSGNNNDWTCTNFSVAAGAGNDSLVDTPSSYGTDTSVGGEVSGNYCTLNPLDRNPNFALSNGNLDGSTGTSIWRGARGTFGVTSGKWYFECIAGSADTMIGIADATTPITDPTFPGYTAYSYGYYGQGGVKYNNNVGTAYGSGYTATDVIGVAFDADNGKVFFSKNGVWQASGDPAAGTNAAFTGLTGRVFFPMLATYNTLVANFGQRPFAYTAPSGFKALCDTNLPSPQVAKPSTVFDTKLYTGNGSSQTISGLGFSPDLVWCKQRTSAASHVLVDTVRGAYKLSPNQTLAEIAGGAFYGSVSPTSDGFSLVQGSDTDPSYGGFWEVGANAKAYAAWCWDAGSSTVTNTQGSITSTVRANASAGFSVVTWTGQTAAGSIGHGLNAAPSLIICKARSNAQSWGVYHKDVGINNYLLLDSTGASTAYSGIWGSSAPTSTVFSVPGNVGLNNNNGWTYVGYCFAPVAGYSSFGSYTGNGSADGPFQWCGFRPRWLLVKATGAINENWVIIDALRSDSNLADDILWANLANVEMGNYGSGFDFTANGFKVRGTWSGNNSASSSYVWAAFAESPFQYARAR